MTVVLDSGLVAELRVGPFVTPSGTTWQIVKVAGKRKVVEGVLVTFEKVVEATLVIQRDFALRTERNLMRMITC